MPRLKDWPSRLARVMNAARRRPFAWGEQDCCVWAADSVQACTGVDPAAAWRGTYRDAMSAERLVMELGGMAAIGALAGRESAPSLATAGDIGLARQGDREMLVVHSGQVWLAVAACGLEIVPFGSVTHAWRVGDKANG